MSRTVLPCPHCGAAKAWIGNKWRCRPCNSRAARRWEFSRGVVPRVPSVRADAETMSRRVAAYAARMDQLRQMRADLSRVSLFEEVAIAG